MKRLAIGLLIASITLSACAPNPQSISVDKLITEDEARIAKCDSVREKAKSMDETSGRLAKQARARQLVWITEEVKKLHIDGRVSKVEWKLFTDSISQDSPLLKLPGGELDSLMQKIVANGWIRPYLPKDVVELGEQAAMSPSGASHQVKYPECFSAIDFSAIQLLANLKLSKGVWADRIENPVDLIP